MANFDLFNSFFSSPTLGFANENEKILSRLIYSAASEEIRKVSLNYEFEEDSEASFNEKIEATKENFKKIIRLFENSEKALKKLKRRFPVWSPLRVDNIEKLKSLAQTINTDRQNCNISKVTSSCVGVVGGAAIVGSLFFPPLALALGVAGGVSSALGAATVFGTSITEMTLLKNRMNEAKEVIQKDVEDFNLVCGWFYHSQELIDSFEKIIGFHVLEEISKALKSLTEDLHTLTAWKNKIINQKLLPFIKMFITALIPSPGMFVTFSELMYLIPLIITFFFIFVLLSKHNSLIFSSVVVSHRIVFGLIKLLDLGSDVGMMMVNALTKAGVVSTTETVSKVSARVIAHGTFAVLGIALDVTNIVFASIDIHQGSISPYAKQLETAAEQLQKEHDVVESVFKELFEKE